MLGACLHTLIFKSDSNSGACSLGSISSAHSQIETGQRWLGARERLAPWERR